MIRATATLMVFAVSACAYYNSLYNANRAYGEAETARREGRESVARSKYGEAIEKAAKSYRSSEDGRWSDDALYLIGRSHARRGDWPESRAALEAALELTDDPGLAAGARVFLGAAAVSLGDEVEGMALLDDALADVEDSETRAEAFLWRARAHAATGSFATVWDDLDSASVGGDRYRDEAALDRLTWAVTEGESDQGALATRALLNSGRAGDAVDTIAALVEENWSRWGSDQTLPLLADAEEAPWPPAAREEMLLLRARVAYAAGDTLSATADASAVSSGVGSSADAGRVLLARWQLATVSEPAELEEVRALLLSAIGSADAIVLLDAIKTVGLLVERSGRQGQALALFAAAEVSRDDLGAPFVARTLFLAYADLDRGSAWEGKALLAALELTVDQAERDLVLERIEGIPDNAYVRAARWELGDRQPEFQAVERRLQSTLATVVAQVAAEAQTRDVLVAEAARALDSIRTTESIARRLELGDTTVLDSLRRDSILADSFRIDSILRDSLGNDSLFADTLFRDTFTGTPTAAVRPRPQPIVRRLRSGETPVFLRAGPRGTS